MPPSYVAALPIAHVVLRILVVLNWLSGVAILTLLTATIVAQDWTLTALGISPASEIHRLIMPLRGIAALGLVAIPLNNAVLKRLLAIVETVRAGDPFVAANAYRLQAIAWVLLALNLLSIVIGAIAKEASYTLILDVSSPQTPVLYATNQIDITQEIIKLYDAQAPAASVPASKPASTPPASLAPRPTGVAPAKKK